MVDGVLPFWNDPAGSQLCSRDRSSEFDRTVTFLNFAWKKERVGTMGKSRAWQKCVLRKREYRRVYVQYTRDDSPEAFIGYEHEKNERKIVPRKYVLLQF